MKPQITFFSMMAVVLSSPASLRSAATSPGNATFVSCIEGTTDPICHMIRQPIKDVITEIHHPNGTIETHRNKYTRKELEEIRISKRVTSVERQPGETIPDGSAGFIRSVEKRESAPPLCYHEIQKWYDQHEWGYWYQSWHQIGNCFYCNKCAEAIASSFAVAQTWTYGLGVNFDDIVSASFGFSWGQTFTLTDT